MPWSEFKSSKIVRGLNLQDLNIDEAFLNITTSLDNDSWLYSLSDNCNECPYSLHTTLSAQGSKIISISTKHSWKFRIFSENVGDYISASNKSQILCGVEENWDIGQFGVYDLLVSRPNSTNDHVECKTLTIVDPVDIYLPLIMTIAVLLCFGFMSKFLYMVSMKVKDRFKKNKIMNLQGTCDDKSIQQAKSLSKRVMSLDTFRGISILLMIFVNDGAGGYEALEHATWNGLRLADVVFPWFLWIMGVCIPISIKSQIKRKVARVTILRAIFKRSCILFGLGLMLSTLGIGARMETLRIFGVLQRFGVLYLLVAGFCAILWPRTTDQEGKMRDVKVLIPQWIIHIALHCAHLAFVFFLHVPECPTGYFGPGGRSEDGKYKNCVGGATGYIDRIILTTQHLYQNPTSNIVYGSGPYDPEGPYGCLPSLLTVMFGVQAGTTLLMFPSWQERAKRWAAWGSICLLLTVPLAASEAIPINKNLWSTSFILVTSGLAYIVLTLCYLIIDVNNYWSGAPFLYPGMNATLMYVGHMVAYQLWPWHWQIGRMNNHLIVLIENLWGVAGWAIVAYLLFRKKFFLSV